MKEFEIETWEVRKTMEAQKLDFDDAAAYVALEQAGYFDGSREWDKYAAAEVSDDVEYDYASRFKTGSSNRWDDTICDKYFVQYGDNSTNHGRPFTQERIDAMPDDTPLTFFPDWGEWTPRNDAYVRICEYYGIRVSIKVC